MKCFSGIRRGGNGVAPAVSPYDIDTLFRSSHPADAGGTESNASAEATRILAKALGASNIAAKGGVSQEEAQRRVDAVTIQAREAADAAREASAIASLYIALSMLVGAFVAGGDRRAGERSASSRPCAPALTRSPQVQWCQQREPLADPTASARLRSYPRQSDVPFPH